MAFTNSLWYTVLGSFLVLQASAAAVNVTSSSVPYSISAYGIQGTGCSPGTVTSSIVGGKDINVSYKAFTASDGPSVSIDENRKNCQFTVTVQTPAGYQFGFDKFSYDGSYSVASSVKASYKTYYYFQSSINQVTGGQTLVGPAKDDCPFSNSYSGIVWSECGGTNIVNIDTSIRIDNTANTAGSGAITVKNTPSISNFVWRTC
ncbi:hypothetical protein CPB83DRAFT_859090 [Crepidotus variabilis]|uniref:Uncharacterized protein n=1 Tax=Crepidotus variabilis TaxID=179855 RepID=A0A9P6EAS2_9AGAR|nr:hypothetical protein CPB83DRAFT_859090 [Crepidotus variabilis]